MDSGTRAKSTVERSVEIEFVRRAELEKAEQEIERLREENTQLRQQLEGAQRGQKRQTSPFSKGEPKANPKEPGRKSGDEHGEHHRRAVPETVDEHYVAALPTQCACGGAVEVEKTKRQIQEDIVRRKVVREFEVETGHCAACGQYHQGRHPLQTSDALDAAGVQVGPEAVALVTVLNKRMGLSLGRAVEVLRTGYGLKMSRGGAWRAMERLASKAKPTYEAACEVVKQSLVVWIDETGWKSGREAAVALGGGERTGGRVQDPSRTQLLASGGNGGSRVHRLHGARWMGGVPEVRSGAAPKLPATHRAPMPDDDGNPRRHGRTGEPGERDRREGDGSARPARARRDQRARHVDGGGTSGGGPGTSIEPAVDR
ncbi:MAG: transposase [Acidobacteria bacterium]|nr:transposase [Acidobacteriota bacterium]